MGLKFYTNFMRHTSKAKFFTLRKAVVWEALEKGIKPAAKRYSMSKNTVRCGSDGFKIKGMMGCSIEEVARTIFPHKTSKE